MQVGNVTTEQLSRYLDLATTEAKVSAQNMANIDTPGYRALGVDFEQQMQQALRDVDSGSPAHAAQLKLEPGLIARPDGNNVSMDRESLNLAEAQLRFRTGVTLLRQQYQMMLDAIRADSK